MRRIATGSRSKGNVDGEKSSRDDYLGRLVKYIPSEIVGLYLVVMGFIDPPVSSAAPAPAPIDIKWLWGSILGLRHSYSSIHAFRDARSEQR
jgi:hypothetical protein